MNEQALKPKKIYDYKRSWNYVLWLLARKAYTKKQLRDKLKKKEAEEEVIEKVMARLIELKFVDDEMFAASYIRSRQQRKGSIALKQELKQKGVSTDIIEKTLEPLDKHTQIEAAQRVLDKTMWRILKAEPQKRYTKSYAFLARRGFPSDIVKAVLEQIDFYAPDETDVFEEP